MILTSCFAQDSIQNMQWKLLWYISSALVHKLDLLKKKCMKSSYFTTSLQDFSCNQFFFIFIWINAYLECDALWKSFSRPQLTPSVPHSSCCCCHYAANSLLSSANQTLKWILWQSMHHSLFGSSSHRNGFTLIIANKSSHSNCFILNLKKT